MTNTSPHPTWGAALTKAADTLQRTRGYNLTYTLPDGFTATHPVNSAVTVVDHDGGPTIQVGSVKGQLADTVTLPVETQLEDMIELAVACSDTRNLIISELDGQIDYVTAPTYNTAHRAANYTIGCTGGATITLDIYDSPVPALLLTCGNQMHEDAVNTLLCKHGYSVFIPERNTRWED